MRKVLVTGSCGNVGRALVPFLRDSGIEVKETDVVPGWRQDYFMSDLRNPIDLIPILEWKPDTIIHLGALVSRVTCEQASSLAIDVNLVGTQNMVNVAKLLGAKFVNFSTSEVYGPQAGPMSEEIQPTPNNRYGLSKLLAEHLIEYEVVNYGLQAVTLRPFMIYDEREDFGAHRSAMIRFAECLNNGVPIVVHRGSERGWLHISDALLAIEAATRVDEYMVINIGHPDVQPMLYLANQMCDFFGTSTDLIEISDLPDRMTLSKRPTLNRQLQVLGIEPKVSLNQGIQRVCQTVQRREAGRGAPDTPSRFT